MEIGLGAVAIALTIGSIVIASVSPERRSRWASTLRAQQAILWSRLGPKRYARKLLKRSAALVGDATGSHMASMQKGVLLYAQGALSFTQRDIESLAAVEFKRNTWQVPLENLLAGITGEHIRKANTLFAEAVAKYLRRRESLRIFEAGPGSGHGAEGIICELVRTSEPSVCNLEYEAVDVCRFWLTATRRHFKEAFKGMKGFHVHTHRCSMLASAAAMGKDQYDVIVSGYSLHHNQSLGVVLAALGELPEIVALLGRATERRRIEWAVRRTLTSMLRDKGCAARREIEALTELIRAEGQQDAYAELLKASLNTLTEQLRDPRGEIIQAWAHALRPGGVLLIADPDGRSWFNRMKILQSKEELIAAANLSDRERTVGQVLEAGLHVVQIQLQYEIRDMPASRGEAIDLKPEWWTVATDELTEDLIKELPPAERSTVTGSQDIDLHLGYIICARKPGS